MTTFPYLLLLGFFLGSNFVVARFCIGQFTPFQYVAMRLTIAFLIYVVVYILTGRRFPTSVSLWLRAGLFGAVGTSIGMTGFMSALQYQSSSVSSLLQTLMPAVTVIIAYFWIDDEILTRYKVLGIIIAFIGAGSLLVNRESGLADLPKADWRGYAWTGLAILAGCSSNVFARRYLRHENPLDVTSIRMMVSATICSIWTAFTVGYDFSNAQLSGYMWLLYAGLTAFLGFYIDFYLTKRFGATISAQSTYTVPVFTAVLGALFLHEIVTPVMIFGMLLIFGGLALVTRQPSAVSESTCGPVS